MANRVVNQHDLYPPDWPQIAKRIKDRAGWKCEACKVPHLAISHVDPSPIWNKSLQKYHFAKPGGTLLTVHHIDFNPQNNEDENLIALCQRCHLKTQGMMTQPRTRTEVLQRLAAKGRQLYFR